MVQSSLFFDVLEKKCKNVKATDLVAPLQVLDLVGKLLGFPVALLLQLLHLPLDSFIQQF